MPLAGKKYAFFWGCMIQGKYPQFEAALRKTMPNLGVNIVDLEEFSCCPDPIFFKATDKKLWAVMAARNLAIAEKAGLDIVTACSGCTATLKEVHHMLKEDPSLKEEINKELIKIGRKFEGTQEVIHIIPFLRDDIGINKVKESVVKPLNNLNVGVHYGCHLLRPSKVMKVDDADNPQVMENFISILGANPVPHRENILCCGKSCMDSDIRASMTSDVLESLIESKVDCMGLICPSCFDEFDIGQLKLRRTLNKDFSLPIIFYFQLLGLAQGFSPEEMGMNLHKIKLDPILQKI